MRNSSKELPFLMFETKADFPVIRFHKRSVLSAPTDIANFPLGWTATELTAPLKLKKTIYKFGHSCEHLLICISL
jgi:hypothetical protein